jgi:hypothetical protein
VRTFRGFCLLKGGSKGPAVQSHGGSICLYVLRQHHWSRGRQPTDDSNRVHHTAYRTAHCLDHHCLAYTPDHEQSGDQGAIARFKRELADDAIEAGERRFPPGSVPRRGPQR